MVTFLIWVVLKCCWDSEANSWAEPGLFLYFGMWVLQQERVPNTWIGIRGWKFQCRLHGGWITSTPLRYFPLLENPISKVMRSVIELPPTSYLCCNLYKYVLQFVGFNGDTRSINPLEKKETIWTSSNNNWWVFSLIVFLPNLGVGHWSSSSSSFCDKCSRIHQWFTEMWSPATSCWTKTWLQKSAILVFQEKLPSFSLMLPPDWLALLGE